MEILTPIQVTLPVPVPVHFGSASVPVPLPVPDTSSFLSPALGSPGTIGVQDHEPYSGRPLCETVNDGTNGA